MAESQSSDSKSTPKENGYIPGDDAWTTCRNLWRGLTGKMTPEGMEKFRVARDLRNEKEDCKRCEDQRDYLLQYSPMIQFIQDNIKQLGGNISNHNIFCRRCNRRQAGGFDPDYGIQICANEMRNQGHLEDTLAHEMIHAYDHMRFKVNWDDNLRHAACAEIRASNLSASSRMRETKGNIIRKS
ncbi:Mitochondrial inner membrane protease atp23 [Ophidiomyces ophidiicola]|nr:Mitochondrial inner membrane protease atp23 [Ophidiomyces ophidiicola]